jgi:protein TonB
MSEEKIETFIPETAEKLSKRKEMRAESYKVKRLEANSEVNSSEAFYLNSWQRKVETIGQSLINSSEYKANNQTVRLMATIDSFGNLLKSEILISSGNNKTDELAIKILQESAPFKPFNEEMQKGYKILEIVRDWNFGG